MDTANLLMEAIYSKKAIMIMLSMGILVLSAAMWIEIFNQNNK